MTAASRLPTAPLLAAGLVGGFALAQQTGVRPLGGAAMLGANAVAAKQWYAVGGAPLAAGLTAAYWTAMGVSHPLAKKVGTWPSVLGVATAAAGAAWALSDRRR
ncbi:hypothetical protein SAMN04489844_1583 [Nocardioides exalbidus]|uniref:Uncharacterized protein n=1 Tax=Nocardioides exalbidus TaxID=402596 RepID=A0A1H4PD08_9ACTN|nr:hypothetical protein [Nocardioides exalbidus]SEC05337.1 hypothetical protein SAMN04489844_1583 [Nocardioides exalbidus]